MGKVLGGDFILKVRNPYLKSDQIVMYHMVRSLSLNGPNEVHFKNLVILMILPQVPMVVAILHLVDGDAGDALDALHETDDVAAAAAAVAVAVRM